MYRIQLKIEIQSDSSTAIDWEQDSDRSTLTRGTFGYKNEFMMETSVSRKFLRYYNNIASLQDWYSTDQTPLQDEGDEPMMDLVTGLQARREHGNTSTETDSSQR